MNRVNIEPVYKSFDGWKTDVSVLSTYDTLPEKMKTYIQYMNEFLHVPVKYISNGPGREQLISA